MKRFITPLAFVALAAAAHAQVFTSGFETWNDTVPADWVGVKTNISLDSVEQVSTNPHAGLYAVRLRNAGSSTKRFTTQPLHVDSAQSYDVTYWVRGQGDIRVALYDARTANSGYSPTTPYTTVNSTTWTQQTASIQASHTGDGAEFILYVRNTNAPDRIVVDDVNITEGAVVTPDTVSVYEIQYTTAPDGTSPYNLHTVYTGGIVTGVDTIGGDSYFIQSGSGPWSGIYVFDGAHQVAIGDSVVLQGTVSEYQGGTEIGDVTVFNTVGQYPVPAPQLLDTYGATLEQWEGVLAVIANATCTTLPNSFGEWTIHQSAGDLLADDLMYAYTPTVGNAYDVTGCIATIQNSARIEPRMPSDIVTATGIAEEGALATASLFPNPANDQLTVELGQASGQRVTYTMTDALGRTVLAGSFIADRNTLDLQGLSSGTYSLTLRTDKLASTRNVQVMR